MSGTMPDLPAEHPLFEELEQRVLLSTGGMAAMAEQLFAGLDTTGSIAPAYLARQPLLGDADAGVTPSTAESVPLINMDDFRADQRFAGIDGSGFAVVILDTGIDLDHPFFGPDLDFDGIADRIVYQWDFADGDADASDVDGHGSNVTSIVAGSPDPTWPTYPGGMATGADIIHLKVFEDTGAGYFSYIESALQWVVANTVTYNIVSVNMSVSDGGKYTTPQTLYGLDDELAALGVLDVVVASSSGNSFFGKGNKNGKPGVAYPSADPNSLSIGAVYDANSGGWSYGGGAIAYTTGPDRITPFSQRDDVLTTVMAPGAPISGADQNGGMVTYHGTSQASPHVAGIAAVAQQLAVQQIGRRLTTTEFDNLLANTGTTVNDGDDENDNVPNTGLDFPRVDMLALGNAILAMSGNPPTAAPDIYNVYEGQLLQIAAPGVLANDTDPDSDPLTAVLVNGPSHADSFNLNSNGSFTYTSEAGYTGSDSFTYMANDGPFNSNEATVTIAVDEAPEFADGMILGTVTAPQITETSGIVASRDNQNVLWVHNDSGDTARVFAINTLGAYLGAFSLSGASAVDYEDIAMGPGPEAGVDYLYVGDIGDNKGERSDVKIYRVGEPVVSSTGGDQSATLVGVDTLTLQYPDGARDAETLLSDPLTGDLYIITKRDFGNRVYRAPAPGAGDQAITLEYMGKMSWMGAVAGDISVTGLEVLVKSYVGITLYERPVGMNLWDALIGTVNATSVPYTSELQGEAVGFDAVGSGYFTLGEGAGQPLYYYQRGTEAILAVDNVSATVTGDWQTTTYRPYYYGANYLHDKNTGKGSKSVTFTPTLTQDGEYEVYLWWPEADMWATNVPVDVMHDGGTSTVSMDESTNGGQWNLVGAYDFTAGTGSMTVRTDGTTSHVAADAVRFLRIGNIGALAVTVDPLTSMDTTPELTGTVSDPAATVQVTVDGNTYSAANNGNGTWTLADNTISPALAVGTYDVVAEADTGGAPVSDGTTDELEIVAVATDVIVDNASATVTGDWLAGTYRPNYYDADYLHDKNADKGSNSVTFAPTLAVDGRYDVYLWWPEASIWATNVPVDVIHDSGTSTVSVDESTNGGQWNLVGTYNFTAGTGSVMIRTAGTTSHVAADAARFLRVGDIALTVTVDPLTTTDTTPELTGTVSDPAATVQVTVDGNLYSAANNGDGTWTLADDTISPALALGTYDVVAEADTGGAPVSDGTTNELEIVAATTDVIIDNASATVTGDWLPGTYRPNYYGADYLHDKNSGKGSKSVTFTPTLSQDGQYDVYVWWPEAPIWATNVPVDVTHDGGTSTVSVNESTNGGQWNLIGTYNFTAGTGSLTIRTVGTTSHVAVDAVRFLRIGDISAGDVIVDNSSATVTGDWLPGTYRPNYYDADYLHDKNTDKGNKSVTFTPTLTQDGQYNVYMWWPEAPIWATNVPVDVSHDEGTSTVSVDESTNGGQWNLIGTYNFTAGTGSVTVRTDGTTSHVAVDAVRFARIGDIVAAEVIVDNMSATVTGNWLAGTFRPGYHGTDYLHDQNGDKGNKSVTFTPTLPQDGQYEVYMWWPDADIWATNVPVDVTHNGGTSTLSVDQSIDGGQWNLLGTYSFTAGTGSVTIRTDGTVLHVAADAVRFLRVGDL